jgi:hypothetical protein
MFCVGVLERKKDFFINFGKKILDNAHPPHYKIGTCSIVCRLKEKLSAPAFVPADGGALKCARASRMENILPTRKIPINTNQNPTLSKYNQ